METIDSQEGLSSVLHLVQEESPPVFYEQDPADGEQDFFDSVLSTPFQLSGSASPLPPTEPPASEKRSWRVLGVLGSIFLLLLLLGGTAFVLARPVTLPTAQKMPLPTVMPQKAVVVPPLTAAPQKVVTPPQAGGTTWLPQQLPAGWTAAHLTLGDLLFAERSAVTFVDREMSLDYRSLGTRGQHGGTLTAATFILTPNARVRFAQNDVRVINNTLFDAIAREQRIQAVINAQPQLVNFQNQGQQQFAWIEVSFQVWQSKLDANGNRSEGVEPQTQQMQVLLLRVPHVSTGAMGGTGWLVSTYALNPGTPLVVVPPA